MFKAKNIPNQSRIPTGKKLTHTEKWVKTHREYLNLKKTDEFNKWSKKQFLYQGGTCYYCHEVLFDKKINVDHKVPKSRGGTNNIRNLVLACSTCNKDKYNRVLMPKEHLKYKQINKKKKGTYLKNKQKYKEGFGAYTDDAIQDKLRYISQED